MQSSIQESLRTEVGFTGRDTLICPYQQDASTLKKKTHKKKITPSTNKRSKLRLKQGFKE